MSRLHVSVVIVKICPVKATWLHRFTCIATVQSITDGQTDVWRHRQIGDWRGRRMKVAVTAVCPSQCHHRPGRLDTAEVGRR